MCTQTRAAALMANIPEADIDPSGVFKYVLIRVHSREEGDDSEVDIVRGYGWAGYHGAFRDLSHPDTFLSQRCTNCLSRLQRTSMIRSPRSWRRAESWTVSVLEEGGSNTTPKRRRSTCTDTRRDLGGPTTRWPPRS
uniref:14 kDa phosphohistidine phosphatase n=1 Tax=Oryzias latipes TaxID=8090 RepID=A0A3B3HDP7_ORYLA